MLMTKDKDGNYHGDDGNECGDSGVQGHPPPAFNSPETLSASRMPETELHTLSTRRIQ